MYFSEQQVPKPDNHIQWLWYRVHRSCLVLNYRQPFYEPMIRFTAIVGGGKEVLWTKSGTPKRFGDLRVAL